MITPKIVPHGVPATREFADVTNVRYEQDALPFVVPTLDRDAPKGMYMTLELARRETEDPVVFGIYQSVTDHLRELLALQPAFARGDAIARARAYQIFSFREVAELGFGYTTESRAGRSSGRGRMCRLMVDTLMSHPGILELAVTHPDVLALIPGIGLDRMSDAIATIAKSELVYYTQQQADLHDFDPGCMRIVVVRNLWRPHTRRLESLRTRLPCDDRGRPFLVVPKRIVRSSPPVRAEQYARMYHLPLLPSRQLKERILEENRVDASALRRVFDDVYEHEHWIRPRREFRDPK